VTGSRSVGPSLTPRLITFAFLGLLAAAGAVGQPAGRRATTLGAIAGFPAFFHNQQVLVRAELTQDPQGRNTVRWNERIMPALLRTGVTGSGLVEMRAEVWDIGRMGPEDPRLSGRDLRPLGVEPTERWPRAGEVVALHVTGATKAEPWPAPSVRALAMDPLRYEDQKVTVTGQFRGRNLFGDLPQAPPGGGDEARFNFVLRSADAAIWVTGKRPRGRGFSLDVNARMDTTRWLSVTGVVKQGQGLVWIVGQEFEEVSPQPEPRPEEPPPPPAPIAPEVLFSAPTQDETDVPVSTRVRIQFSRDLRPDSIKGHVQVSYLATQATERGEPQPPAVDARLNYNAGTRVLELSFSRPLERFRTLKIELQEGIVGTDGAPLKPWTLSFTLGGT
jgi:Bacterial Ig-like domain